ncbi:unnamed protein product [Psylliodes chrysocephalus]|uniref:Major facilitator superfamily (MFS) profile domain-containing protein n=1 Tax=Psylliodes chrysocephalus TaxID=3402493 RepID=A0A9P0D490_9CUCU|nr:unnamed protein product [Psylliodes chrysocephala]
MDKNESKIPLEERSMEEKELKKLIHTFQENDPASFEEAIVATGFGKYNYILLFCIIFPSITQMTETVSISYVLPVAECDLDLSLEDKGILNAVTFAGMIVSGLFWGYMIDALGRKQIIVYGYFATGFLSMTAACSSSKFVLIIAKFVGGLILNGPYSASTTHITEFHSSKHRANVNMVRGFILSIANILIPVLAWAVLPRKVEISVLGLFVLRSWNVFLLIAAFCPIISGCLYVFLPESPKFLMTIGKNRRALLVMQEIYAMNSGNPAKSYPIKRLAEETTQNLASTKDLRLALGNGLSQMKTIFHRPHFNNLILVCFNAFSLVMSLNTLKLWLPGIFQSINDYQNSHNGTSSTMCVMLEEMNKPKVVSSGQTCSVNLDNISVYINTFIVAFARIAAFMVAGTLVNWMGNKKLIIFLCLLSSSLMFSIYFANNSTIVTILSAAGSAIGSVPENVLVTITMELFPTTLRAIALSIHLMSSRLGTIIGNISFPYLVHLGCLPPFLYIGIFGFACGIVSSIYSNTENKPLI